jgi:hypothetical protein
MVAGLAILVPAGAAAAGIDQGYPAAQVPLRAGVAWLASNQVGQLTLIDGSAAEVAARVTVGRPGSSLLALQQGADGYAVNRSDGSIVRVDGATFATVRRDGLLPRARDELRAFPAGDSLYALDGRRGTLAAADPRTLVARQRPVTLAAGVEPDASAVDGTGQVWTLDPVGGGLVWSAGGERRARPRAGTPGASMLTTVGGQPVLVDLARRRAELLDPGSGEPVRSLALPLQPQDRVLVAGSAQGDRLHVLVTSGGTLLTCTFASGSCGAPVRLAAGGRVFGPPVEAHGRVLVPDHRSGAVSIVDPVAARIVAMPAVLLRPSDATGAAVDPAPRPFELVVRDGVVFYNDPDGDQAGVIDLDGRVHRVRKYDSRPQGTGTRIGPAGGNERTSTPPPTQPPDRHAGPPAGPGTRPEADGSDGPGRRNGLLTLRVEPGTRGAVGQQFRFSAAGRDGAKISGARWIFGDGALVRSANATHRWSREGTYRVSVSADVGGRPAMASVTMVIGTGTPAGPPRIARIGMSPLQPRVGDTVRFRAVMTGMTPDRRTWTLAPVNGALPGADRATGEGATLAHTFAKYGRYRISFTVGTGTDLDTLSREFMVEPAAGVPGRPRCGGTITTDVKLTGPLECTGRPGLTIGASGVTLDLNNFTLSGSGLNLGVRVAGDGAPLRNIKIINGRISGFGTGIHAENVQGLAVDRVVVSDSFGSSNNTNAGLVLRRARDVAVTRTTLKSNTYGQLLLVFGESERVRIADGSVLQDGQVFFPVDDDLGEQRRDFSIVDSHLDNVHTLIQLTDRVTFARNTMVGDGDLDSMSIMSYESLTFEDNTIENTGAGLSLLPMTGSTAAIRRNLFADNHHQGMYVNAVERTGGDVLITGNRFYRNGSSSYDGDGDGLLVALKEEDELPASRVVVRIGNNRTSGNHDYGIEAHGPPGSIRDLGGNTTTGDGCEGVYCAPAG